MKLVVLLSILAFHTSFGSPIIRTEATHLKTESSNDDESKSLLWNSRSYLGENNEGSHESALAKKFGEDQGITRIVKQVRRGFKKHSSRTTNQQRSRFEEKQKDYDLHLIAKRDVDFEDVEDNLLHHPKKRSTPARKSQQRKWQQNSKQYHFEDKHEDYDLHLLA